MVSQYPVPIIVTAFIAVINACLVAAQAFGLDLTADQSLALAGVLNTLGALAAALVAQRRTTPYTE